MPQPSYRRRAVNAPSRSSRYTLLPGSHIPVVTPEALLGLALDDMLVLPWNIGAEIAAQLREGGFRGRILTMARLIEAAA
jgi:hypothetical protein